MSTAERAVVSFGTTEIPYAVHRSARRRTVSIAVDAESRVVVTAPASASMNRLEGVVRQKAPWIVERLRRRSDLPPAPPSREFVSGENFCYLGKQYRLQLVRGSKIAPLRLLNGRLYLPVPADLAPVHEPAYAQAALTDWYIRRARSVIPKRAERWNQRVGTDLSEVLIASAGKRWGSASKDGTIRINWRVVQAALPLVDYVLAHELAHLVHHDHGHAFWALLGRVMPDYETRKARLRVLGPELQW